MNLLKTKEEFISKIMSGSQLRNLFEINALLMNQKQYFHFIYHLYQIQH